MKLLLTCFSVFALFCHVHAGFCDDKSGMFCRIKDNVLVSTWCSCKYKNRRFLQSKSKYSSKSKSKYSSSYKSKSSGSSLKRDCDTISDTACASGCSNGSCVAYTTTNTKYPTKAKGQTPCNSKAAGEFLPKASLSGGFTCGAAQHTGFFTATNASQCDKDGRRLTQQIMIGGIHCCKSKEVDQTVCKMDKCEFGLYKCSVQHSDMSAIEEKLTDPKAMEKDPESGKLYPSCIAAIKNRVDQGKACCTVGMKAMGTCIPKEAGDHKVCKDMWIKLFKDDRVPDQVNTVLGAFQKGGFCDKVNPNPTKGATAATSTAAAKATTYGGKGSGSGQSSGSGSGSGSYRYGSNRFGYTGSDNVCKAHGWPDRDHGLVCAPCKVLVDNFNDKYKTCDGYCATLGRKCVGAWEEVADTCKVEYAVKCSEALGTSDAICECSKHGTNHPKAWYDCKYKGFRSCVDDSICKGDGGNTECAKSTVDAGMCTTPKATYCGKKPTTGADKQEDFGFGSGHGKKNTGPCDDIDPEKEPCCRLSDYSDQAKCLAGPPPGLRLKSHHASIQLGHDHSVILQRVGERRLSVDADYVTMHELSADDIYVQGRSLRNFIDQKIEEMIDDDKKDDKKDDDKKDDK